MRMSVLTSFVFQAEDGIRDLVRSRGLGDVYKRQAPNGPRAEEQRQHRTYPLNASGGLRCNECLLETRLPVSYTHLTLPTSDLV